MNRKILFSLLILLTLCCMGSASIAAGSFFAAHSMIDSVPLSDSDPAGDLSPAVSLPATGEGVLSSPNIPPELAAQMDEIQRQVISLRGLPAKKAVSRDLLSTDELKNKVETDFFKDYTAQDAADDTLILQTIGLLPNGFDLLDFYENLYAEQVAGYYDSKTGEMYVVKGSSFGGMERMTYAHEYTHTLQDQTYDLRNGLKLEDDHCRTEPEYCAAVTALLEGDASFTEQKWMFRYASDEDKSDLQNFSNSYLSPVFNSAPMYMQKDFLFPYTQGLEFVYSLNDRGGYSHVDEAFKMPPVSTEQILHPDKYPSEVPVDVTIPYLTTQLPGNWKRINENVMGEWYTYLIVAQGREETFRLPETIARTAAAGWGGDRYALYTNERDGSVVFLMRSRWDTSNDAVEFFQSLRQYGQKRWGAAGLQNNNMVQWVSDSDGLIDVRVNDKETLWLITPNKDIQQIILDTLQDFYTPSQ